MTTFHLPDVGEGLHTAEIVTWHVAEGDHVVADQPLVSIETDKAVVEIPSPRSGHIAALHGEPGDVIEVGTPLVEFTDGLVADTGAVVGEIPDDIRTAARAKASPAVRTLAERLGVDLDAVTPTGPDGTVTRADVEAGAGSPAGGAEPGGTIEPLRGVRRAMAANMARAHAEVVPATVTDDADVGDWPEGTDATLRLIRAIGVACLDQPSLNAHHLGADVGRRLHDHVDLGIAVDTDDGLFVPVLRDVTARSADELRAGLDAMRADIVARTIPPDHLRGQTITLSNFGMIGGRYASLVVVPPQVAIVGAGRTQEQVVAVGGQPVVTRVLPLSLTFDHRVVTGGEAARFLAAMIADLEEPT